MTNALLASIALAQVDYWDADTMYFWDMHDQRTRVYSDDLVPMGRMIRQGATDQQITAWLVSRRLSESSAYLRAMRPQTPADLSAFAPFAD